MPICASKVPSGIIFGQSISMRIDVIGVIFGFCISALAFAQSPTAKFDTGNTTGSAVYPKAVVSEHTDGRGTVSLVDGAQGHRLAANA